MTVNFRMKVNVQNNNTNMLLSIFPKHLPRMSKDIRCISQNSNSDCYYDRQSAMRTPNSNITNMITIIEVM